jgi:hypothetical protein
VHNWRLAQKRASWLTMHCSDDPLAATADHGTMGVAGAETITAIVFEPTW